MSKKNDFLHQTHVYGRIATLIAMAAMLGIPAIICTVYGVWPALPVVVQTAGPLLAVFVPAVVAEVFAFVPVMGTTSYLNSIFGNVTNIKVPCALNALELTGAGVGSEEGDSVMMCAVCVSAGVTMVIIAIGVVLLIPLEPVLTLPVVRTATGYLLPSLFGSMAISNFMSKNAGDYIFEGKWKLVAIPVVVIGLFSTFVMDLNGKEGYTMCIAIPLIILLARFMFNKGIIKMIPKESNG